MATGLDAFKQLLTEFRGLSIWAVGGSVVVPFAAALAELSPPWPPGVVLVTAIVELLALVFVFQFLRSAKRQAINWVLSLSTLVLFVSSTLYLLSLSLYTYQVPTTKERFVKGYQCTPEAVIVFKDKCPDLGLDELKSAEYESERLWTRRSVTIMRTALVITWAVAFMSLSVALGSFLVFQTRTRGTANPAKAAERSKT